MVGKVKFEARIKKLVENLPDLAELVEPRLSALRFALRGGALSAATQNRRAVAICNPSDNRSRRDKHFF
jgi:hypothetical protein